MKSILIGTVFILFAPFAVAMANDNSKNNQMVKDCLDLYGYDRELPVDIRLNTFDFSGPANCVAGFRYEEHLKKVKERKEFLEENPWFRGSNWKWEERAEYTCSKIYSTAHLTNITVCQKPYYVN